MTALISIAITSLLSLGSEMLGLRKLAVWVVLLGLLASAVLAGTDWGMGAGYFSNMLVLDNTAVVFNVCLISLTAVFVLLSRRFFDTYEIHRPEAYALLLFSLAGAVSLASYGNLVMLFLGVEMMSIPMYVMAGSDKRNLYSHEASLKYFIMGAFASGFLLFGIALLYGASGTFDLNDLANYTQQTPQLPLLFDAGIMLVIVAMLFKISAFPMHFWAPDVYDGSPTIVTMFMTTVVKAAAFVGFMRLFHTALLPALPHFGGLLAVIAALTMCVGNLSAVFQTSIKRVLAYSGIAHAGYLMMALISVSPAANSAVLFYGVAYCLASLTAFSVLLVLYYATDREDGSLYNGLARRDPMLAFAATIALLSLAGIPPTAGFFGKYFLFTQTIETYPWLTVVAVVNSLISVFYYFRLIVNMYARKPETDAPLTISFSYRFIILLAVAATLILGLFPDLLAHLL